MTLSELLRYLDTNTDYPILDGSVEETLVKARAGSHRDALVGTIVAAFTQAFGCESPDCLVDRAGTIKAMGPIRLKYMGDDAPLEAFRLVQHLVVVIDGAFNEEALRLKGS
ncbi:MAG: hypothetical protein B7Z66_02340 [Chromatiales bacterium 21-64-14]|nr:MAG: hypothetical protein B7Z66_02340 [Chromatiales bacterium 21-64-14]HQU16525.1 hypothetical protein [Gammaproteobacteria bacterium]